MEYPTIADDKQARVNNNENNTKYKQSTVWCYRNSQLPE
jgi:hypothetical protein